jgi:AraC-like DNA-binding protein
MLTGKADLEDRIEALEKGADAYLTKPFSLKELQVRVEKLISQRRELRQRYSNSINIRPSEVSVLSMDQEFMQKLLDLIGENFESPQFSVTELAEGMNMSLSQLNRKLNALIGQAPGQLIRSMRLQRAADLIESQAASIGEVAYQVGFNDQAYFSRAFKKQFGCSPSAYKGRRLNL